MGLHGRKRDGAGFYGRVLSVGSGDQCGESGRARDRSGHACVERTGGVVVGLRKCRVVRGFKSVR